MSKKTLRIDFNVGERYKIDLKIIASLIANKEFEGKVEGNLDAYTNRIDQLYEDEMLIFEQIWDIPWDVLKEYAIRVGAPNFGREWSSGEATVSVTE
jgi:hypothetical protein